MTRHPAMICALALALAACERAPQVDYTEHDIATLQALMASGELSSRELVDYYLQRIASIDQGAQFLNSIIELNPDAGAIADALDSERRSTGERGPLHGIPVLLKANIDTGDRMTTTAGSLALANHIAADDAFLVARLRDAGAIILGKTNLSEWANFRSTHSSSGWSSIGGQTRNPYQANRNPCGSSSGSAVAVSANLATLAVGTETNGSVICPSATNGIVGIKPTIGLVSRDGIIPIAATQDTAGPMARSVLDAALMLNAMAARDDGDPAAALRPDPLPDYAANLDPGALAGKRIGVLRSYSGAGDDYRVEKIFEEAIATLGAQGAVIVDPVEIDTDGLGDGALAVLLYEFRDGLNRYLAATDAGVKNLADIIEFNRQNAASVMPHFQQELLLQAESKGPLSEDEYLHALELIRASYRGGIDEAIRQLELDALVAPSNGPAWTTDHVNGDNFAVGSSSFAAISGYANVTVPAGFIAGLPIGVSFIGTAFSERVLIEIAYGFEQASKVRHAPALGMAEFTK